MACQFYGECTSCSNYHPMAHTVDKMCDVYGEPIGSGDAYCKGFRCDKSVCNRSICIDEEELYMDRFM